MFRPFVAFIFVSLIAIAFQLGIFDRPSLVEDHFEETFYFIVASSTSPLGPEIIKTLLEGSKAAVFQSVSAAAQLTTPASLYGAPDGAEALSAGFYFDDPHTNSNPRWGIGWAVQITSEKEAQEILEKTRLSSKLTEPFRIVKIGKGARILRGRIPWRSVMTPAIAPMLHWQRFYQTYHEGNYSSNSGREGEEGSVACEIYVTGSNNSMEYIDYIILMGDTKEIFDGMFPPTEKSSKLDAIQDENGTIEATAATAAE